MLSLMWRGEKLIRGESTLTWGEEKLLCGDLLVKGLRESPGAILELTPV